MQKNLSGHDNTILFSSSLIQFKGSIHKCSTASGSLCFKISYVILTALSLYSICEKLEHVKKSWYMTGEYAEIKKKKNCNCVKS